MKFTLEIKLGNDAMQTVEDVQSALSKLVDSQSMTRAVSNHRTFEPEDGGKIMDVNGNAVGHWEITE